MAARVTQAGRIARAVRHRLDRDPRLAHLAVGVLAVAALLALPLSAAGLLDGLARVRAAALAYTRIAVAADDTALALERALRFERIASVATDDAALRAARARFELEAGRVPRDFQLRHAERLPPGLRTDIAALRGAIAASLAELRRRIPATPPHGAAAAWRAGPGLGLGLDPAPDEAALGRPLALVAAISAEANQARLRDVRKIDRRERAATLAGAAIVAAVVLLLAGAASRLIAGRQRLNAARGSERLQALRLERAVNGMREGVALFDRDMTLIVRNERFAETAGLTAADCAVGTPFPVIATALAHGLPPALATVLGPGQREAAAEMRVGGRVLDVFRALMPGGGEILTVADVTLRVESEAVATRAVKLEALGRLTSGVAHDFNNLLQGLSANLETLGAAGIPASEAERRERFEASLDLVERGTRLTRQLLSFTRARPADATAIDTAALLRGLEDLLARTIGDRIELQLVLDPDLWPVLADRSGLENAILNLAINARDAMPEGGTISIVGANVAGAARAAVEICVADSGIGMDPDQLRRATEPFFTTKPEGAGTGLGLAMVSGFAQAAGGALALASEPGRGTRATLRLPRAELAPDAAGHGARGAPLRGLGETILLVEDDHAVRRAVRSGLQAIGYRVVEAASIDVACRLLDDGARPDLVLSDVMLPGSLEPAALLAHARAISRTIPVVFNTGDPDGPVARALPLDERTVLLVKPWRLDEMARLMRRMLAAALEEARGAAP